MAPAALTDPWTLLVLDSQFHLYFPEYPATQMDPVDQWAPLDLRHLLDQSDQEILKTQNFLFVHYLL